MTQRILAVGAVAVMTALGTARAAAPARPAGAGELMLDAAAVGALIETGLPDRLTVTVPGWGPLPLAPELRPPVRFAAGGVEADLEVAVPAAGVGGVIHVRYVPAVDPRTGVVRLRAETARGTGALAVLPELAPLFPPIDFPRSYRYLLGEARRFTLDVQGLEITPRRLVVRFGVRAERVKPGASGRSP